MDTQLFLGAYWHPRQESVEQCADRLIQFFSDLPACDAALATWYETGWSRKQALEKRADFRSRDYHLDLLNRGRNRDDDKKVIEDLGFQVDLWNGAGKGKAAGLRVTCGLHWVSPRPNAGLLNCVTLDLPEELGELRKADRMVCVLAAVSQAWEPDWAGVMSRNAMNLRDFDARSPFVDWMLYLSKGLAPQVPPLPAPASVQKVDGLGSIIVVQGEPPDVANPEHLRNIERVEAALKTMV